MSKIKYGICNCHYAKQSYDAETDTYSYAKPVSMPGMRSISLEAKGELVRWYADNVVYWSGEAKNGYSGNFELAMVPSSFKTDILGFKRDENGVLYEDEGASGEAFALLFQFEGDEKGTRHAIYNCTASRPGISGSTKEENIEPQTDTVNIESASIPVKIGGVTKNIAKSSTDDETTQTTYDGWFDNVYIPA